MTKRHHPEEFYREHFEQNYGKMKSKDIAEHFGLNERTVYKIAAQLRQKGIVMAQPKPGRPRTKRIEMKRSIPIIRKPAAVKSTAKAGMFNEAEYYKNVATI